MLLHHQALKSKTCKTCINGKTKIKVYFCYLVIKDYITQLKLFTVVMNDWDRNVLKLEKIWE